MTDAKTLKQISALQCAVRVMEGTAGGYTKQQIQDSRLTLMELILEMEGRNGQGSVAPSVDVVHRVLTAIKKCASSAPPTGNAPKEGTQ